MKLTLEQKELRAQTDALQDSAEHAESLVEAVKSLVSRKLPAPEIIVQVPKQAVPQVKVEAPNVIVQVPPQKLPEVKVEMIKPVSWKFDVTARDINGRIKSFTATPQ